MRLHDLRKRKDAIDPRLEVAFFHMIEYIFLSFCLQLRIGKYFAQSVSANCSLCQRGKQRKGVGSGASAPYSKLFLLRRACAAALAFSSDGSTSRAPLCPRIYLSRTNLPLRFDHVFRSPRHVFSYVRCASCPSHSYFMRNSHAAAARDISLDSSEPRVWPIRTRDFNLRYRD